MRTLSLVLAALIAAVACAPRLDTAPEQVLVDDNDEQDRNREALETLVERAPQNTFAQAQPESERGLPVLPVTVVEPPETEAERGEGRIERDELRNFIDGGPHQLFRAVMLEPVLNGERFQGFVVASISSEPAALRDSGIRVGDVVTAVNGTDISRPEGFMRVWDSLGEAEELRVEIVRHGDPKTLAWHIE